MRNWVSDRERKSTKMGLIVIKMKQKGQCREREKGQCREREKEKEGERERERKESSK